MTFILSILLALPQSTQEQQPTPPSKSQHPLSASQQKQIQLQLTKTVDDTTAAIKKSPGDLRAISTRADALFFLGKFKEAVRDYDKMVELDPATDASHWRRGIAYFYANDFDKASKQFERYHSFDNIDRENGIWRYLSQHKAKGQKHARQGLLKYEKDDREPFPAVYKLFAGQLRPDQILNQIAAANISKTEREKRTFYAELYIGLNELVERRPGSAQKHLHAAVATEWPRTAGFGPNYMWHVGRLQLNRLRQTKKPGSAKTKAQSQPKQKEK
jgi:lipoprotein NlpI